MTQAVTRYHITRSLLRCAGTIRLITWKNCRGQARGSNCILCYVSQKAGGKIRGALNLCARTGVRFTKRLTDKMKILHVADYLPGLHDRAGGAEFATLRTIEEQVAAGLEVEVATLRVHSPPGKVSYQRHHEMRNLDRFAPKLAYAVKQLYFPFDSLAASDLARAIKFSRPDVVHYHNLHFAGLSVVSEARAAGIPSVWSVYDYWLFCPSFMLLTNRNELCAQGHSHRCVDCIGTRRLRALKPLKRLFFHTRNAAFRQPASAVDRLIVLSDASRDLLIRHGIAADRIHVIPQYIWKEAAAAKEHILPTRGRLVYVGWVEQRKGLHVIIQALGLIAKEYPEVHLEVLGLPANSEYQTYVEQLAGQT